MPAARLTGYPACRNGIGVKQSVERLFSPGRNAKPLQRSVPGELRSWHGDGVAKKQTD
jgi:hypothetical protein